MTPDTLGEDRATCRPNRPWKMRLTTSGEPVPHLTGSYLLHQLRRRVVHQREKVVRRIHGIGRGIMIEISDIRRQPGRRAPRNARAFHEHAMWPKPQHNPTRQGPSDIERKTSVLFEFAQFAKCLALSRAARLPLGEDVFGTETQMRPHFVRSDTTFARHLDQPWGARHLAGRRQRTRLLSRAGHEEFTSRADERLQNAAGQLRLRFGRQDLVGRRYHRGHGG